ncbi:hypothetical protein R1flu_015186 [Riccia fluitans]|uniref:S1 motif domain-containing protein n=1 Tax=Riccia fluitans TaxID=41844 RepID=A0ABD1YIK0_9MARC
MEGLAVVHANIGVFVHPSRSANVKQGVHEILNSLLLKFNEEFDGVVLAYLKPKIIGKSARILAGLTPYFHVDLTAKLLIFSPSPGMLIEGKVNKIEKDYIGVVVLGLFNAAVGVSDIREDLYYNENPDGREWVSESDERHSIKLGSIIRFSVKSMQETEHIIDLCGSLADSRTGCVNWLELPPITPSKKSKRDRSASDGGRKQKTPNKVKKDPSLLASPDVHDGGKVIESTEKDDVRLPDGTPHSDAVGKKHKSLKKEKDLPGAFETPDAHKQKKHANGPEESTKPVQRSSEVDTVSTVSGGHKHKKRKEADEVRTPDESHHKKKKKKEDVDAV